MIKLSNITKLIAVAGLCAGLTANAALEWTEPLTLSSHDLVGAVKILQNDPASGTAAVEAAFAQKLLDLGAGVSMTDGDGRWWGTAPPPDYSGTIVLDGAQKSEGGGTSVPAGWEYAMAKYDGKNAGYVLFHLGGQAATLPATSADIWVNGQGNGYGISGMTLFNPVVPEPTTVLAGLMLLLPFGASAIRIIRNRK